MPAAKDRRDERSAPSSGNTEQSAANTDAKRQDVTEAKDVRSSRDGSAAQPRTLEWGSIVAWIALLVSIAGFFTTFSQLEGQKQQLNGQKQQLALQERQLDDAEGNLSIGSAYVDAYDPATRTWATDSNQQAFQHKRLMYDAFTASDVYIVLDVFNVTHTSLVIKRAGLIVDARGRIAPTGVMCPSRDTPDQLANCKLPYTIPAQTDAPIYLRVVDAEKDLACNKFVNNSGLVGAIQAIDNRIWSDRTQTYDPFSPVCPLPAPPTH